MLEDPVPAVGLGERSDGLVLGIKGGPASSLVAGSSNGLMCREVSAFVGQHSCKDLAGISGGLSAFVPGARIGVVRRVDIQVVSVSSASGRDVEGLPTRGGRHHDVGGVDGAALGSMNIEYPIDAISWRPALPPTNPSHSAREWRRGTAGAAHGGGESLKERQRQNRVKP
jgi:hypothetical protein